MFGGCAHCRCAHCRCIPSQRCDGEYGVSHWPCTSIRAVGFTFGLTVRDSLLNSLLYPTIGLTIPYPLSPIPSLPHRKPISSSA